MTPRIVLAALFAVVLLVGACQQPADTFTEDEIAAIRAAAEQEVVEAMLAGDWERFAATFTEDAVRLPPDDPLHRGRAAIKQWAEENWGPLTLTEFTMTVEDVDGCGVGELCGRRGKLQDLFRCVVLRRSGERQPPEEPQNG